VLEEIQKITLLGLQWDHNFCQLCIAPFQKILKLFKILQIRKQLQVFVFFLSNLTEILGNLWKNFLLAFIRIHGAELKKWLLIKIVQNYDNILILPTYCIIYQTSCGVNGSSLSKLFLLKNLMNIDGTTLLYFFLFLW
jgi:hypothetical protein